MIVKTQHGKYLGTTHELFVSARMVPVTASISFRLIPRYHGYSLVGVDDGRELD